MAEAAEGSEVTTVPVGPSEASAVPGPTAPPAEAGAEKSAKKKKKKKPKADRPDVAATTAPLTIADGEPEPEIDPAPEPQTEPDPQPGPEAAPVDDPAWVAAEDPSRRERRRARKDQSRTDVAATGRSEVGEQLGGLLRAAHPRQALLTGVVMGAAAYVAGRPAGQAALAGLAVLVVQAVLGLVDDAVDAGADERAGRLHKPVAQGHLPAANARFVAVCLVIVAIPLSLRNGWVAAVALLAYLVLGMLSSSPLRRTVLSWLPWAASFAVLPAFLAYGGSGLGRHGDPPSVAITATAAAVGIGVHFLLALPDLVADHKTGIRHLPLRIALRTGAGPLLVLSAVWTAAACAAVVYAAATVGLRG